MAMFDADLMELDDRVAQFVRDLAFRLFHVVVSGSLREMALRLIMAQEWRVYNRSPFVLCEQGHDTLKPGWDERRGAVRGQQEFRWAEMEEQGQSLEPLPPAPTSEGLLGFAEMLSQLLYVGPPGSSGLIVVLAPEHIDNHTQWEEALEGLLAQRQLQALRWIIMDNGRSSIPSVLSRHKDKVLEARCFPRGPSPKALMAQALDAEAIHWGGSAMGARPKGVIPPRRTHSVPSQAPNPARIARMEISKQVLLASVAAEESRNKDAVAHQRQARDLCIKWGQEEQAVMMELMLGGYLSQAGVHVRADESYQRAATIARQAGLDDKVALASIALGSSRLLQQDKPGALIAFSEGAVAAEQGGQTMLAVDACRLAGDTAVALSLEAQAVTFWSKAVTLGERTPELAPLTSASEAAFSLALLCKKRGLCDQADLYLLKAQQLTEFNSTALSQINESNVPVPSNLPSKIEMAESNVLVPSSLPPKVNEAEFHVSEPVAVVNNEATKMSNPKPKSVAVAVSRNQAAAVKTNEPKALADGTARMTMEELEALHWGGRTPEDEPVEPAMVSSHHWTDKQQESLRHTTMTMLGDSATLLLTAEELRQIHERVDVPDARVRTIREQTLRLDASTVRGLRRLQNEQKASGTAAFIRKPVADENSEGIPSCSSDSLMTDDVDMGEQVEHTQVLNPELLAKWRSQAMASSGHKRGED